MGYINIFVASQSKINIKDSQLVLDNGNQKLTYPIEDINSVVIDNSQSYLSCYTISKLSQYGIVTYVCDEKHIPNGLILPFCTHYHTLNIYEKQINLSKPLQKQLWQSIIKNKIDNQNEVLNICGIVDVLKQLSKTVQSGDVGNNEAKASLVYFKYLFGKDFTRSKDIVINDCLNYGYTIVRGIVARSIVAHGLLPFVGVFHHNQYNQYNLADDLMEVFRPLVDLYVISKFKETIALDAKTKFLLQDIINYEVVINNQRQTLNNAIDMVVEGYLKSIKTGENYLKPVSLIGLNRHEYE